MAAADLKTGQLGNGSLDLADSKIPSSMAPSSVRAAKFSTRWPLAVLVGEEEMACPLIFCFSVIVDRMIQRNRSKKIYCTEMPLN